MTPTVTVLMPVFNGERYLRAAIESILGQSFGDFEFLIINDGSTDKSVEIIRSYTDPRVRLVENDRNLGLILSLNKGIAIARGGYIARMDCDDISLPYRLQRQVEFMDAHADVGMAGAGFQIVDEDGKKINMPVVFPAQHYLLKWSLFFYSPFAHPTVVLRKKALAEAGGYATHALHAEDYDLWYRMSKLTRLSNLPDVLLYLRKHNANITQTYLTEHLINSAMVTQSIISDFVKEAISLELLQKIKAGEFKSVNDVLQVGRLIKKYYLAFIGQCKMEAGDKKLISEDAANRLYDMALPFMTDFHLWGILLTAFRLRPHLLRQFADGLRKKRLDTISNRK